MDNGLGIIFDLPDTVEDLSNVNFDLAECASLSNDFRFTDCDTTNTQPTTIPDWLLQHILFPPEDTVQTSSTFGEQSGTPQTPVKEQPCLAPVTPQIPYSTPASSVTSNSSYSSSVSQCITPSSTPMMEQQLIPTTPFSPSPISSPSLALPHLSTPLSTDTPVYQRTPSPSMKYTPAPAITPSQATLGYNLTFYDPFSPSSSQSSCPPTPTPMRPPRKRKITASPSNMVSLQTPRAIVSSDGVCDSFLSPTSSLSLSSGQSTPTQTGPLRTRKRTRKATPYTKTRVDINAPIKEKNYILPSLTTPRKAKTPSLTEEQKEMVLKKREKDKIAQRESRKRKAVADEALVKGSETVDEEWRKAWMWVRYLKGLCRENGVKVPVEIESWSSARMDLDLEGPS